MRGPAGTLAAGVACCVLGLLSGCVEDDGPPRDTTLPEFADIVAQPDPARAGDTLTITFTASEQLSCDPTVTVGGGAASFVSQSGLDYVYGYLVQGTEAEGTVTIVISGDDPAGNTGSASGSVTLDFTAPTFSGISAAPDPAKAGDTLTITFAASEPLAADPVATVDGGVAGLVTEAGHEYTYSYLVQRTEIEGPVVMAVSADDVAGNSGTSTGSVTLDFTGPTFSGVSATPDPATPGDTLTIAFTASEPLSGEPTVALDGNAAAFVSESALSYAYEYLVQGTETDGPVSVDVSGDDAAGNSGSGTGSVRLEVVGPDFGSVLCSPDPAKAGVTVVIEFSSSEVLSADPAVTVDGLPATLFSKSGLDYVYHYPVQGTEFEGIVTVEVTGSDPYDNPGTGTATVTLDFSAPTFSGISATPDRAKAGDTLTVAFTASEALSAEPAVVVGGNAAELVSESELLYVYEYVVKGTETESSVSVDISGSDAAGNSGSGSGSVTFDFTAPTFSGISATPDPAEPGDTLTVTFTASEALSAEPSVTVDGKAASFLAESALLYTYSYLVQGTETEGSVTVAVSGDDQAGNPGSGEASVWILMGGLASLFPVDWDLDNQRWKDVANNDYDAGQIDSYSYPDGAITLDYDGVAPTLTGALTGSGLKPNFAYQVKLNGKPTYWWGAAGDDWANEQLGYAGRWWLKKMDPGGDVVSEGNSTDAEYDAKGQYYVDGDGNTWVFEGYLLFDFAVTDASGAFNRNLALDSSLHVLWKTSQRAPGAGDATPETYTVVASSASDWYALDYATQDVSIYGEGEADRPTPGNVVLPDGVYNVRMFITEEDFHETMCWVTVMVYDDLLFAVAP